MFETLETILVGFQNFFQTNSNLNLNLAMHTLAFA
jgi:hypothetical protein